MNIRENLFFYGFIRIIQLTQEKQNAERIHNYLHDDSGCYASECKHLGGLLEGVEAPHGGGGGILGPALQIGEAGIPLLLVLRETLR